LNNLGVVMEAEGEFQKALAFYDQAAVSSTNSPVIVTMDSSWRGKPVAEMARANSKKLTARMKTLENDQVKVALLNLRGVAALNRNDYASAERHFSEAYKLHPRNAFSLNNQGYLAEIDGDLESAEELYREARAAQGAETKVGLATRSRAEGTRLYSLADDSKKEVESALERHTEMQRKKQGPIQLKRRDGAPVTDSSSSTPSAAPTASSSQQ
jgi:tetratricopeptide (TPR) repeat protein